VLAFSVTLIRAKDYFQFQKVSQPIHAVQMDAGLADQVEGTRFPDFAGAAERGGQDVEQDVRIGGTSDGVV
jgi:hypothetical protein